MSSKALREAVKQDKDGSWGFYCPVNEVPIKCGRQADDGTVTPFNSTGWPTRAIAEERGAEHFADHKDGKPASELADFLKKHGLVPHSDGRRAVFKEEDL